VAYIPCCANVALCHSSIKAGNAEVFQILNISVPPA